VPKPFLSADPRRIHRKLGILETTYHLAHELLGCYVRGGNVTLRNREVVCTQLEWWRAMEFLRAAGIVVRGELVSDDINELYILLTNEKDRAEVKIKRMRPPSYVMTRKVARGY
jgi:hypothetical protein